MIRQNYPATMTLAEARARFFERSGLGDYGGYNARWVRVETKPFPVYFPNTACRVEAAKLHDLHHIANEYETDWPGEVEIAAWEIASGCGRSRLGLAPESRCVYRGNIPLSQAALSRLPSRATLLEPLSRRICRIGIVRKIGEVVTRPSPRESRPDAGEQPRPGRVPSLVRCRRHLSRCLFRGRRGNPLVDCRPIVVATTRLSC